MPFLIAALVVIVTGFLLYANLNKFNSINSVSSEAKVKFPNFHQISPPKPAPNTSFTDKDGQKHTLSEFKGELLIVNLWATWCPPCIKEMPDLAKFQTRNADKVKIIAIDNDGQNDHDKAIAKFNELTSGALEFYSDHSLDIGFAFETEGLPSSFIINKEGQIIARIDGEIDWNDKSLEKLIFAK